MIPLLGTASYTVTRRAAGARATTGPSRGEFIEGAATTFSMVASIQPLSGHEAQLLPEGVRDAAAFKCYTESQLQTAEQDGATQADSVSYRGQSYTVTVEQPYPDAPGLRHRKYILSRATEKP